MRYVVSDLHGELGLFVDLLKKLNFSVDDKMYICGDMIDKGEHSVELVRLIMSMPNAYVIFGNHEYSFLKYYHARSEEEMNSERLLKNLQEYFPTDGHLLDWETVDWLDSLPAYIEEEDFICVHAGLPLDSERMPIPLSQAKIGELVWDRRFKEPDFLHYGEKCIFFGHTQTNCICGENKILAYRRRDRAARGDIRDYYKIHLDTGTWTTGTLGCFCIDNCKAYYITKQTK